MGWKMSMAGETLDTIDRPLFLQAGFYHVRLDDSFEDTNSGRQVFEFVVVAGPSEGQKLTERLNNPDYAEGERAVEMAIRRMKLFAGRLGVVTKADEGKEDIELDWTLAIGKEFAIHVQTRSYTDKSGQQKEATNMAFDGVWSMNPLSDKMPNACRKALGLPLIEVASEGGEGKPKGGRGGKSAQHPDAGSGKPHAVVDTSDL